jgi:hypothetical protein
MQNEDTKLVIGFGTFLVCCGGFGILNGSNPAIGMALIVAGIVVMAKYAK